MALVCVAYFFVKFPSQGTFLYAEESKDHDLEFSDPILKIPQEQPRKLTSAQPEIQATSAIAIDLETHVVLFEKNADEQRSVASLAKIMTAVVALDRLNPSDVVKVPEDIQVYGGSLILLRPKEEITVGNLIKGLLVSSGNDAAVALARNRAGTEEKFIEMMNKKARGLSMENTNFVNPVGYDDEGQYGSARDLADLTAYAFRHHIIREAVQVEEEEIYSVDSKFKHTLESTDELLGEVWGVNGVKTGTTQEAGQCLITSVNRDGNTVIIVLLNSPERFEEMKYLIEWVFGNWEFG